MAAPLLYKTTDLLLPHTTEGRLKTLILRAQPETGQKIKHERLCPEHEIENNHKENEVMTLGGLTSSRLEEQDLWAAYIL